MVRAYPRPASLRLPKDADVHKEIPWVRYRTPEELAVVGVRAIDSGLMTWPRIHACACSLVVVALAHLTTLVTKGSRMPILFFFFIVLSEDNRIHSISRMPSTCWIVWVEEEEEA